MRAAVVALFLSGCSGFEAADAGAPDMSPSLLAGSLVLPVSLAVNDHDVYWLEFGPQNQGLEGSLSRADKRSGCAQAGCLDRLADMRFLVVSLALAADDVCWLEYYDAMREIICMSLSSAQIRRLTDNQPLAFALFTDGSSLYWVNGGATGAVQTTPIARNQVTTLAAGRNLPSSVSIDDGGLYWSELGAVYAAGRAGESPHAVAMGLHSPASVQPFGDWLYFTDEKVGQIQRARKDGSSVETLLQNELAPFALAVDESGVYFLAEGTPPNYLDGEVARVDLDGQHRRTIAAAQPYLSALAIDDEAVYFTLQGTEAANYLDGALWRAPKP